MSDFKSAGERFFPTNRKLLAPLMVVIFIVTTLGSYFAWIHGADHRDFYPRWAGARMALEGSKDLYSLEATERIQVRLYGKSLPPDRDQQGFAYPAISLPFLIPFALIPDVEIATALWVGIAVVLLLISYGLLMSKGGQGLSLTLFAVLMLWSYPLLMLFQGQMTGLVIASLAFGYWAFQEGHDLAAGISLTVGLVKPQLVILPVLLLMFYAFREKRPRVWLGAGLTFLTLFAASVLLSGWWVGDWVAALVRYTQYAQTTWALAFLWNLSPLLGLGLIVGLGAGCFWISGKRDLAFAAALAIQLVLFPQTLIWGLSILSISLLFAWINGGRFGVLTMWLLGWVAFLTLSKPGLWEWQTVLLPMTTYTLLLYLSLRRPEGKNVPLT
ncbi:MAG: glycosyltransferase family 87 protein [Anaerolineales bacterium]